MSSKVEFIDILQPRKAQNDIFRYMTRDFNPQKTFVLDRNYTPQEIKDLVANSLFIDTIIEGESVTTGITKHKLKRKIKAYLEEMGFDKRMSVIRWMGIFFLKMSAMMKIGIFVNEPDILKIKSSLGSNPVLFLPTHRSYADFCLMTYLCYHYDIDFPVVAAGMDFYTMAIVGRMMRETCAFYIRRTLAGSSMYAATLKHYVRTVVAKYSAPVEFFLEGTRSRSNKSLPPKYGILSMSLLPLFSKQVPDITIVPVNISYDRLIELSPFSYEHLGVPKPKESTGSLIKSIHHLNDPYGNIYMNFGAPVSIKEYLKGDLLQSEENLKPVELQDITPAQFAKVQEIGGYIISLQQECTVATISNLVALVLMGSIVRNEPLRYEVVLEEVGWMVEVLRHLGAQVFENDIKTSVERIVVVLNKVIKLDQSKKLRLISSPPMMLTNEIKKKMKGHVLKAETMVNAVPVIQLQLYVNPILHYLVPPAIMCLIVYQGAITKDQLKYEYFRIRRLLKHEFFYLDRNEESTFDKVFDYCIQNKVISLKENLCQVGEDMKLQFLLKWSIWPTLTTLSKCAEVMTEQKVLGHKQSLKVIQEQLEASESHPYCLSLDAIANCLQGLVIEGALVKGKSEQEVTYEVVPDKMNECRHLVSSILPNFNVGFGKNNCVIVDQTIASRL